MCVGQPQVCPITVHAQKALIVQALISNQVQMHWISMVEREFK